MAQNINASLLRFPHFESLFGESIELSDGTTLNVHAEGGASASDESITFDVTLMPVTKYVAARELGLEAIALPIFPVRRFTQWMVEVPENSDIHEAKQLEGKRIASIDWGHTCAVFSRGVLEDSYDVDLSGVSWVTIRGEQVEGQLAPDGVECVKGTNLDELLASEAVDAALTNGYGNPTAPGVRRLWADPEREAAACYASSKYFPIVHLVVVTESALAAHESLAHDLFEVFEKAKNDALVKWDFGANLPEEKREKALQSGFPGSAWGGADRSFLGRDPLPYGLEANYDAFDLTVRYAYRQRAVQQPHAVEDLFAPVDA